MKKSQEDYNHIWLGLPLDKTEDSVFTHTELDEAKKAIYPRRPTYDYKIAGFDIARYGDDKCACVIIQQNGVLHWEVVYVDQWDHKDLNYTTGRIFTTAAEQRVDKCIIDEDGMGAGPLDTLIAKMKKDAITGFRNPVLGYDKDRFYGNPRTANTYLLKDMFLKGHLHVTDEGLLEELGTLRYEYDHNQRRILISKEKMKKQGVKSPNMADALIMAVSLIDEFTKKQENYYGAIRDRKRHQSDNLFEIAGVR